MPKKWHFIIAFALVYVFWGSTYLAIRIAIETLPPFLMAGTRFMVSGLTLSGVALILTKRKSYDADV